MDQTENRFYREKESMQELKNLAVALVKAQSKMQNAAMNKTNPHFKSKFADLAAVREATLPALNENGLSILQTTHQDIGPDGQFLFYLRTTLLHSSGEKIEGVYPLPRNLDKPQALGSALTYARRYSWAAMCGIASDEDDDANEAQDQGAGRKAPPKKGRDIMHDVGKGEPEPPSLEVFNQFGETIDIKPNPQEFLKAVTDLCETSGAYWPNNKDNVEWCGKYYKDRDKTIAAQARATFKFGRDTFKTYSDAKSAGVDPALQGPVE